MSSSSLDNAQFVQARETSVCQLQVGCCHEVKGLVKVKSTNISHTVYLEVSNDVGRQKPGGHIPPG